MSTFTRMILVVKDVPRSVAYQSALKAGATAVAATRSVPWGMELAHVRDLDGIVIEIGRHTNQAGNQARTAAHQRK